jgi:hypothetical protein
VKLDIHCRSRDLNDMSYVFHIAVSCELRAASNEFMARHSAFSPSAPHFSFVAALLAPSSSLHARRSKLRASLTLPPRR